MQPKSIPNDLSEDRMHNEETHLPDTTTTNISEKQNRRRNARRYFEEKREEIELHKQIKDTFDDDYYDFDD